MGAQLEATALTSLTQQQIDRCIFHNYLVLVPRLCQRRLNLEAFNFGPIHESINQIIRNEREKLSADATMADVSAQMMKATVLNEAWLKNMVDTCGNLHARPTNETLKDVFGVAGALWQLQNIDLHRNT